MNCRKTQEQQEQIHIARQPIFDMQRQVYGYELLFRRTLQNTYDGTDPDQATLDVVTNSFLLFGIESLTRGKLAFINFTANNLLTKLPAMLPREQVAVEILEDVKPDEEVLRRCRELKSAGYMLVLDDFVYKKERLPLVELADIVKIDFRATSAAERQQWQAFLAPYDLRLLAEKVETEEEFQEARAAGYTYVQGYYFSKPALVSGNALPACKANHFKLLQEFSRSDLEFGQIEAVLRKDVSLSYNLLKFINSALFGFRQPIRSLHQAMVLLGHKELSKWGALVALKDMGVDKPGELILSSLVRARFGEQLAMHCVGKICTADAFLLGLFSHLDALLDRPLADILSEIPVKEEIERAFNEEAEGVLSLLYNLMQKYEQGQWQSAAAYAQKIELSEGQVLLGYREALNWAQDVFTGNY
ncbi:MAG: EAL domain-containing protein [Anaeromusa sp.]|uniref:EAL and HDOD domain-containing protein n=1 Tax=Anaeromusa sp. TaxID=1872520 RepID=UPI002B1FE5D7|nr:EAL domain-containing protein [Anaeromusa sp.]MEA4834452.1 EAL domain-containing protein [Anaeromusa sp.]